MDNVDSIEVMWSKQYWFAKASNGEPLSDITVFGTPYSLNNCFRISIVAPAVLVRTLLMTGNLL